MLQFLSLLLIFHCVATLNAAKVIVKTTGSTQTYSGNYGSSNQSLLLAELFENYYAGIIPKCDGLNGPVDVKVGIALRQIIDINEREQVMNLNAWIRLSWTDCQLRWDPTQYGGVSSLTLPYDKIWSPDITLYDNNQESEGGLPGLSDYRPTVSADGTVSYNFPTVLNSLCTIDPLFFPFDTQICPMKFGSWSFNGKDVNVVNMTDGADVRSFKENVEWDLVSADSVRHEVMYQCCPDPYPDVTFYVKIARKPASYVVNIIFPCILISAIALLGFILPVDSGEKIGLEMTVLLALAVYAQIVSDSLPPSAQIPYIGVFFSCSMLMVFASLIITVLVLNVHFRGQLGKKVPRVIRTVVLNWLARLVFLYDNNNRVHTAEKLYKKKFLRESNGRDNQGFVVDEMNEDKTQNIKNSENNYAKQIIPNIESPTQAMLDVLKNQLLVLKSVSSNMQEKIAEDEMAGEWQQVALVMDRLFFTGFLFCTVVMSLSTVLSAMGM